MAANNSKPYQLEQIRDLGFLVPETLVTTDPSVAREFWERHGAVIYKSVSSARSIVSRLRPEHVERLGDVSHCPTQFQQYIHGKDHRVHVVGEEIFASEVLSEADDYRRPGGCMVEVRASRLPWDIEERCRMLAAAAQLSVAGIDLRKTPEGDWYCFEINPSPAFTYYETSTGQPIGNAIARLLTAGAPKAPDLAATNVAQKRYNHAKIARNVAVPGAQPQVWSR
jgi:glutathione synthase/RimK-type ligase-like ATP-grasp enzyme